MLKPMTTPFFPAWRPRLAPAGTRVVATVKTVSACTLARLEDRFGAFLPATLFTPPANSRERVYTVQRTFWCFLWQILNPGASCREVVRQLQALFALGGGPRISAEDGAYCLARQRLPAALFPAALTATAQAVQAAAPTLTRGFLQDRPCKLVDGTTVTLPDSKPNQKAYPKPQATHDGIGFPMLRVVALFCLSSGAILTALTGHFCTSEVALFVSLRQACGGRRRAGGE